MATMKDIAAACGTSIATVSYVLSGRGDERRISLAMQERVARAAEELGYDLAGGTRKNRRPTVAVCWPQRKLDSMPPSFISGMNTALGTAPITADVVIRPFEPSHLSEQSYLWTTGRVGASVIVSASAEDVQTLENKKTTYPAVLANRSVPGYPSVSVNENEASRLAMEYVKEYAGDDMILVLPDSWLLGAQYRSRFIQDACSRHAIHPRASYTCASKLTTAMPWGRGCCWRASCRGRSSASMTPWPSASSRLCGTRGSARVRTCSS